MENYRRREHAYSHKHITYVIQNGYQINILIFGNVDDNNVQIYIPRIMIKIFVRQWTCHYNG